MIQPLPIIVRTLRRATYSVMPAEDLSSQARSPALPMIGSGNVKRGKRTPKTRGLLKSQTGFQQDGFEADEYLLNIFLKGRLNMNAGAAAGAAAAAVIQATRASGVIVRLEPASFSELLRRNSDCLVVHTVGGVFSTSYQYLMSYKGLAFFTSSPRPLAIPSSAEVVKSKRIWIPG